jgi:hypothetical protein
MALFCIQLYMCKMMMMMIGSFLIPDFVVQRQGTQFEHIYIGFQLFTISIVVFEHH